MTRRKILTAAIIVGSVAVIGVGNRYGIFTDDESETLANVLKTKMRLPQALTVSEQEGQPISAKYEMEGGKLQLSIYTTKDGRFFEIIIDPTTGTIAKVRPIAEGEDLAHAKAQSAARHPPPAGKNGTSADRSPSTRIIALPEGKYFGTPLPLL